MKTKTSWRSKLEKEQERRIVDDPKGRGKLLIPKPLDIDGIIRLVQLGRLITDTAIREKLARDFHADFT